MKAEQYAACRGNVDVGASPEKYPEFRLIQLAGWRILLLHIAGMPPKTSEPCKQLITLHRADAVVFGHSHEHVVAMHSGVLFVNPGSAGPARFKLPRTAAILDLPVKADGVKLSTECVKFTMLSPKAPSRASGKRLPTDSARKLHRKRAKVAADL